MMSHKPDLAHNFNISVQKHFSCFFFKRSTPLLRDFVADCITVSMSKRPRRKSRTLDELAKLVKEYHWHYMDTMKTPVPTVSIFGFTH